MSLMLKTNKWHICCVSQRSCAPVCLCYWLVSVQGEGLTGVSVTAILHLCVECLCDMWLFSLPVLLGTVTLHQFTALILLWHLGRLNCLLRLILTLSLTFPHCCLGIECLCFRAYTQVFVFSLWLSGYMLVWKNYVIVYNCSPMLWSNYLLILFSQ